ncbi:ParA family protein [Schleiferilactobacillus harbinensis]|uniref:AAA family ATPase n=1 Tax=Schleiferilactobacillus harbinensis TaxID=304207 RepID=A0ABU7T3G4_9LACO
MEKVARSVAFSSNKGGVLKTSLAVNVAGALATNGKKTLMIDMDNQGNVATSFGKDPDDIEFTIYDLLTNNPEIKSVQDAVINVSPNLDIIVANDDMAYFEIDVLTDKGNYPNYFNLLKNVIKKFERDYDFIVLDTPPAMGLIAANIFDAVQDVVIPFQPEQYAFRSLVKTVDAITKFRESNSDLKIIDVVPTKVRNTNLHRAFLDAAKNYCKTQQIPFSKLEIRDTVKYGEMTARLSIPITMMDDLSKTLEPYKSVYDDLVHELGYLD